MKLGKTGMFRRKQITIPDEASKELGISPMSQKYGMTVQEMADLHQWKISHNIGTVGLSNTKDELLVKIAENLYSSRVITNMFGKTVKVVHKGCKT